MNTYWTRVRLPPPPQKYLCKMTMEKDYYFLVKAIGNKQNKPIHIPTLKRLLFNFEKKWPLKMKRQLRFLRMVIKQINI